MAITSVKDGAIDLEVFLDRMARDQESIVIERDGRPVAILAPFEESAIRCDPARSGPTASEARLKAIMDCSPVEIGLKDTAGRYVMVSRRFEELNGVTNDEAAGTTADELFPEATARAIAAHDAEVLRTGEVSEREIETTLDDGVHTYLTVKFPILDAESRVTGIGAISSDVTERKRAQEVLREAYDDLEVRGATRTEELTEANRALRAREAQLRQAHQITSLGHWSWYPETDRLSVSPEMAAILGAAPKELEGLTNKAYLERFVHPDDRERVWKFVNTPIEKNGRSTIEYRLRHSGDTERWVQELGEAMVDEAGELIDEVGTIQDITERKRTERALQESEERLRDFAEATSDWFWEMDENLCFSYLSERFAAVTGLDPQGLIGKTRWEYAGTGPEDGKWSQHKADLLACVQFRDFRYERAGDDGKRQHFSISGKPVFDARGDFKGYRGTGTNMTVEVEALSHTEEARARFFDAIENSSEAIALFDGDDKLVLHNSRYGEIVDRVVPGLLQPGIPFERIVREAAGKGFYVEAEGGNERWVSQRLEDHRNLPSMRQHHLGDGSWLQVREQRTSDGGVILVLTDITELRESEARLRQAQKMEAVGQLTGGVAHDFNNLLAVIMGNAEILTDRFSETDSNLDAILRATRRGAELTNRLLAFSRRQALAPKSVDLDELVLDMTDLLGRTLGETILVTASKTPGLWHAAADPNQLENALVNLAINARDAMPGGGKLVIETANMPLRDSAVATRHGVSTGEYVSLLVTDNGHGMTPEVRARAADPFFTTKGVGQGSGLGLSMVEGFARQSGGFMTIESSAGAGTMVKVLLPRAKEDSEMPASDRKAREPEARGATILVVEDDPGVRDLAVSILKRLDYRVIDAQDGRAALEILRGPEPINLILTDVVLPGGLSGPDLVTKGKVWQPGVRALFMSGYATDVLDDRDRLNAAGELLNKPFRRAELAERVRSALDHSETGH